MKILKKSVPVFGVALFWILLWQLAAWRAGSELLLPSPIDTACRLFELAAQAEFWLIAAKSLLRVFAGALAALAAGVIFAVACAAVPLIDRLLAPILSVIRATPVASFIILALLWIGRGALPSFISFLMVFPIVFTNVKTGIEQVPKDLLEMARLFKIPRRLKFKRIYASAVAPYFVSSAKSSLGLAWKAGIAAEVLAFSPDSIGRMISQSKNYLLTVDLFAWTALIIILSLGIEYIFGRSVAKFEKHLGGDLK